MLKGLRVLEAGHGVPGPMAGMILSDLGADVIKVEGPRRDPLFRTAPYQTWNRDKRVVQLDLKQPEGLAGLETLLRDADVFLDSTGMLRKTSAFAPRRLAERYPRLVYCSLSAYPPELEMDHLPPWDTIMSARAGIFTSPYNDEPPERGLTELPIASTYAALTAANGIMAGLVMRERTGQGQWLRVSMIGALFQTMGMRLLRTNWSGEMTPRPSPPRLTGSYRCADGRWIRVVPQSTHVPPFLRAMGMAKQFDSESLRVPAVFSAAHATLTSIIATRTAAEWERYLSDLGLCGVVCLEPQEWLHHPDAAAAALAVRVETARGPMLQPGPLVEDCELPRRGPIVIDARDAGWGDSAAPAAASSAAAPEARRPLEGVRVVDLSMILAGPTCGRLLAELGADVIKVDGPDTLPGDAIWLDANRGKRSLQIDLKHPRGLDVLWRLLETADVIIENFTLGTAEKLGFGYDAVEARNPRAIYVHINCFGHQGPRAGWHGWEHSAQATAGIEMHEADADGTPHMIGLPLSDYGSAYAAAIGALAALRERESTGRGRLVRASLAAAAGLVQSMHLWSYEARGDDGSRRVSRSGMSSFIRCEDGLVFVQCAPQVWQPHVQVAGHDGSAHVVRMTRAALLTRLAAAGIAATRAPSLLELYEDQELRAAGLIRTTHDDAYGMIDHVGSPYHASWAQAGGGAAPIPGQHSRAVLKEIGYSGAAIARLIKQGAILEDPVA